MEQFLEVPLLDLGLGHYETCEFVKDLVEFDIIFILCQGFAVAQSVFQLSLAVQQLVQVPQEQFQLTDVAALLVPPNALYEDFVYGLESGNEVAVHVLHFGVLRQKLAEVGVRVEIVVVPHQVLSEEDAGIKPTADFRVNLFGVVHELFKFFGEGDHALGESWQQFLNEIEVFVELAVLDDHGLAFEVVEGHLEVDLFELFNESLCFFLFVEFH